MLSALKRMVKRCLAVPAVRKAYEGGTRGLLEVVGSNRAAATVYSIPGLVTFNREQYAVLRGRRDYYRNLRRERTSHTELRRNIHRLEKGISMRPRRDVFATDYIGETVEYFEVAVRSAEACDSGIRPGELAWAHNVLAEYFSLVKPDPPMIGAAKARFEAIDLHPDDTESKPYRRADVPHSDVTYEQLLDLSRQRRSTRWFLDRPVPRELIDKALLVARQSPTACNRMPYEFKVFDDPELVKKVSAIPFGTAGYAHQIPTIIVVTGKLDSYFSPRDRHIVYIDASLAVMGFMYAAETLGLASSSVNWPDFEPLEMKMERALGLSPSERVVMLIAVGYPDPDGIIPFSHKKDLDIIRTYNPPVR